MVRDAIDERIDTALRSYAEPGQVPEARVVLARVMERARERESQSRGWWMWGAVAAVGLAVMLAVGGLWVMRSPRQAEGAWVPKAPGVAGTIASGSGGSTPGAPARDRSTEARAIAVHAMRGAGSESLPKREVFPTERPLSAEERALVAFANEVPANIQQQVIEAQKHAGDPIAIAELKIAPPNGGEKQDSNEQERNRER
jgi:hypothetical protein